MENILTTLLKTLLLIIIISFSFVGCGKNKYVGPMIPPPDWYGEKERDFTLDWIYADGKNWFEAVKIAQRRSLLQGIVQVSSSVETSTQTFGSVSTYKKVAKVVETNKIP